jgi:hypothetical protein
MRTKLQLYTVPGQVYYNSTRQLVLKGADGIVFVADSQDFALDANQESLQNLEDNLKRQGIRIREIPLVLQYNKRDLPNAMPVVEMNTEINKQNVPHFESVATTGIGVEETLKGITQLVLAHLIKKYGLEGSEPLEREIQILNANTGGAPADSLWDEDDVPAAEPVAASRSAASSKAAVSKPAPPTAAPFVIDDSGDDDDIPLVATELIGGPKAATAAAKAPAAASISQQSPFDDVSDYFSTSGAPPSIPPLEVPMTSIEMALPEGILNSLPDLSGPSPSSSSSAPSSAPPSAATNTPPAAERRVSDGLVKEVTVPLNLTMDELRKHRRLKLKITLDVNLLP